MLLEVFRDGVGLVLWDGVEVAESTARGVVNGIREPGWVVDGALGVVDGVAWVYLGGADAGDEWACAGPGWVEDIVIRAKAACWAVDAIRGRVVCTC